MRSLFRFVAIVLGVVVVLAGVFGAWAFSTANARYQKQWEAHSDEFPIPFPLPAEAREGLSEATADSLALAQAIERGRHLVDTRLGCTNCHGQDYGGSVVIDAPIVGHYVAPNLTEGQGSVTRGFTAHNWDMAVRHAIRHNGRTSSMPSEEFTNLSDHELSDVVAYVRSRPAVDRDLGPVKFGPVFAVLVATQPKLLSPFQLDHQKPHPVEPPTGTDLVVRGRHIAQVCIGCHGANLSGGKLEGDPNMPLVANLTPHATGLKGWTEADFLRAFHEGKRPDGSAIKEAMPWKAYGQMGDEDLKAVWSYLQTLPPTEKGKGH